MGGTVWSSEFEKVNGKYGEIKLCKTFAKRLLYKEGSDATHGIDAYDHCGIMMGSGGETGVLSRTYFALETAPATVMEGATWMKMSPEWKFFNEMRPPYYDTDKFEISWNHDPPGENSNDPATCFGAASGLQVGSMVLALVAFVA